MKKELEPIQDLFPEVDQISDEDLRRKVIKTWQECWKESHFERLEDVPTIPEILPEIDILNHTRAVTVLSIQFAQTLQSSLDIEVNMDYVIAGAILHDVGKLFEFCDTPSDLGRLFSHRLSGLYMASKQELPLEVMHIIAMHSLEGELKKRSVEAAIVHHMDHAHADVSVNAKTGIALAGHTKYAVIQKRP